MAVGYTLVYGTVGLIHFAHGDVVMLGGCLALAILSFLVPLPVAPGNWLLGGDTCCFMQWPVLWLPQRLY